MRFLFSPLVSFSVSAITLVFFSTAPAPVVSMKMNMNMNSNSNSNSNSNNKKKGCATHGGYRLQATSYTLTPETTLVLKEENCRTNFGKDAFVFDFSKAPTDFAHEEEFNQALAAVFFKQPAALFYVTYQGTDEPTPSNNDEANNKFVIQTTVPSTNEYQYGDFGRAHLSVSTYQAQLLCAVPVKEYKPSSSGNKPYKSPDESSGILSTTTSKGIMLMVLVLGLLGTGLLALRRRVRGGTFPVMFAKACYTILPQSMMNHTSTATNNDHRHDSQQDVDAMMAHCELSSASSSTNTSILIGPNDGI